MYGCITNEHHVIGAACMDADNYSSYFRSDEGAATWRSTSKQIYAANKRQGYAATGRRVFVQTRCWLIGLFNDIVMTRDSMLQDVMMRD